MLQQNIRYVVGASVTGDSAVKIAVRLEGKKDHLCYLYSRYELGSR
jgi:hypothetical protein